MLTDLEKRKMIACRVGVPLMSDMDELQELTDPEFFAMVDNWRKIDTIRTKSQPYCVALGLRLFNELERRYKAKQESHATKRKS